MDREENTSGGYDADFYPSLTEDFTCCICFLAFREPMQLACGHQYCRSCLHSYRKTQVAEGEDFACPVDRELVDLNKVFPDKSIERKVMSLIVNCSNLNNGCEWRGELRNLPMHVGSCALVYVNCSNDQCTLSLLKVNLDHHLATECMYRIGVCVFCGNTYVFQLEQEHSTGCMSWPINCINSCGREDIPRNDMPTHILTCPRALLPCRYKQLGCEYLGTEDQRDLHEKEDVHSHLQTALDRIASLQSRLEVVENSSEEECESLRYTLKVHEKNSEEKNIYLLNRLEMLERRFTEESRLYQDRIRNLEDKVEGREVGRSSAGHKRTAESFSTKLKHTLMDISDNEDSHNTDDEKKQTVAAGHKLGQIPAGSELYEPSANNNSQYSFLIWQIPDFRKQLKESRKSNNTIYSEAFYTSPTGYKLRLFSDLNGYGAGKDTHLSLYFQIMRGAYDDQLTWPFCHKYTLTLLHHTDHTKHKSHTVDPNTKVDRIKNKNFSKPTCETNAGFGNGDFYSHQEVLHEGYVHEDTLLIRCDVEVTS